MRHTIRHLISIACILGAAGIATFGARAETAADFFAGKTITYIAATKPGGGYDTYARLIAEHMEKYLPGTRIVVKNVPGAGHIVGTNQLYVARPDGLTIGTFNTGLIYAQILGKEGVQFDLTKLSWIGKAASDPRVMVVGTKSGITDVSGLKNREQPALFASSGVGTASHNETIFLAKALGLNVKAIPGFSGNEGQMAMLRGDVAGTFGSYSSLRPFVENGYGKFLFQVGGGSKTTGNLPSATDLAVSDDGRSLIAIVESQASLGRLTAAPPGVPADRLELLRGAYRAALDDPGLLAAAAKMQIPIDPLYGDKVAAGVRAALEQPASTQKLLLETTRE